MDPFEVNQPQPVVGSVWKTTYWRSNL